MVTSAGGRRQQGDEARIFLPADIFRNNVDSGGVSLISYAYKDDAFFMKEDVEHGGTKSVLEGGKNGVSRERWQNQKLNSVILSARVLHHNIANLKNPINLEFKLTDPQRVWNKSSGDQEIDDSLKCSFWEFNQGSKG